MAILSKACKPDNFESHNSLKLSFTNIQDLCLNFVDCESFLESNSPDILALCETNLDGSIDSGNFPVRLSYNPKGFQYSYAWFRNFCEGRTSFCYGLLQKTFQILTPCQSPSSLCTVFDSFLSKIDEVRFSRSTYLLMFLFLVTLTSIIRTKLPILVELIDLVNSVIIFLSQTTLLRWLTLRLASQTVILTVLHF